MSADQAKLQPLSYVPQHIAIIMDGNGRWAQERGLPRLAGHRAGTENLRNILSAAVEFGVPMLTLYAFSTENWSRPPAEVAGLMRLLERSIENELDGLNQNGVRLRHLGRRDRLSSRMLEKIDKAIATTQRNTRLQLNIALNYGGRAEIVDAVKAIIRDGVDPDQIDEALIGQYLYTAGLPDPELLIRTSGEMRLSYSLIWQSSYAELYVTDVYWPAFDRIQLHKALLAYSSRQRRFGGVVEQDGTS